MGSIAKEKAYQAEYYRTHTKAKRGKKPRISLAGLSDQEKRERVLSQKKLRREATRTKPKRVYLASRAGLSEQEKRDRRAMQMRQWTERNKAHHLASVAVYNKNRRAYRLGAAGRYTKAEWTSLCASYDHRCLCCGQQGALTADHVIPISKGGANDISNIQPLCGSCNSRKGTKPIDYRGGT